MQKKGSGFGLDELQTQSNQPFTKPKLHWSCDTCDEFALKCANLSATCSALTLVQSNNPPFYQDSYQHTLTQIFF